MKYYPLYLLPFGMISLKNITNESTQQNSMGDKFRQRRMRFFNQLVDPLPKPLRILDVGGNEVFWVNAGFQNNPDFQITILNLTRIETHYSNFKAVAGNATDLSGYPDQEFDIVFSNSVIEHLYTRENQLLMAREVVRTGKYHFIQTPNKYFFIESHYLLPFFFHYLPRGVKFWILTETRLSRLQKWDKPFVRNYLEEIRLLSYSDMKKLFPDSVIWKERILGGRKSFIAHNFIT